MQSSYLTIYIPTCRFEWYAHPKIICSYTTQFYSYLTQVFVHTDHGFPTNPFQNDRFASANSQYENPEMCPPPNYPINLSSQPHMSKQFDSSGYCDYGYALSMQHNATDGQNDDDDEDSRGWCLASTEEDNIRLVTSHQVFLLL